MARKNSTTDKDMGAAYIRKEMAAMKRTFVTIGVHKGEGDYQKPNQESKPVVEVAGIQEFGEGNIPERSFLRSTFDKNRSSYLKSSKKLLNEVLLRKTSSRQALRKLGFKMSTDVRRTIIEMRTPGNAPSTIKEKPHVGDNPLINSRKLVRSIGFQVDTDLGKEPVKKPGIS